MSDINTDVVDKAVTQFRFTKVAPDDIYAVQADVFAPYALGAILNQNTDPSVEGESLDLSRFSAAPRARLSHLSFESDRAFPAQC